MVDPVGREHPKTGADRPPRPPAINGALGTMAPVAGGPPKPPRTANSPSPWPMACSLLLLIQFLQCLSFAYFKSILIPHLVANFGMDQSSANASLQLLVQISFFAAFVGGLLADAKYGKYGTLIWLFPAYLLGQLLISFGPLLPLPKSFHPYFDFTALFVMAYGCGCVRGVLPAYGADQIWPPNLPQISAFFAFFYAQEHLAIICSSLLLPFIQNLVIWPLPPDKPLFGVLSISTLILGLAIATLVFVNRYFRQTLPQGQNVFSRSWHTIGHAIHNKKRYQQKKLVTAKPHSGPPPKNVLDHFLDDHNCERDKECDFGRRQICGQAKFIAELKSALRIYLVLSPLPLFWALHAQLMAVSRMQAHSLDPRLPFIRRPLFPPSICQLLPNFLVLLFIPFFYLFLFRSPSISQCLSLNTYLRRMAIGLFLFAFAGFFSASIQMLLNISPSPSIQSTPDSALFKLFNTFPSDCTISLSRIGPGSPTSPIQQVDAANNSRPIPLLPSEVASGFADFQFRFSGPSCGGHRKSRVRIWTKPGKLNVAVVGPQGILWTAFSPSISFQSTIGVLALLPCNSLDSPLPLECANSSGDPLAQALIPYASGLSLCPSNDDNGALLPSDDNSTAVDSSANATSSSSSSSPLSPTICSAVWMPDEAIPSQLFVFPPRGDNLGMGRGNLYEPKAFGPGTYILTLNPSSSAPIPDSSPPNNDSSAVDSSPSPAAPPSSDSNSNASSSSSSLQQPIVVDDSGSISLLLLSLDGSPLAGQNDSSPRPNPTVSLLLVAPPPSLNILWIYPQNMLMAAGEVLLCITALEFCYVQAPNALKTTIIGFWYLTIYLGLAISPQLAKFQLFTDSSYQLLFGSFSLFSVGLIFTLIAHFLYKYRDNLTGNATANGPLAGEAGGLAEKLEGTLRASIARLPTRKVIRL